MDVDNTRQHYIYVIANRLTGKVYIGQTVNPYPRFSAHRSELKHGKHRNPHLSRAWAKYGPEAFEFYTLDALPTQDEADGYEKLLIAWFQEIGLSYHISPGGARGGGYSRKRHALRACVRSPAEARGRARAAAARGGSANERSKASMHSTCFRSCRVTRRRHRGSQPPEARPDFSHRL